MAMTPKEWVENWKQLGPILEQIETGELQTMDHQAEISAIMEMCDWNIDHFEPEKTSGLVEQQRLFAKLRTDKK